MEFRVLGCHGGKTPKHRTSAFLIDDDIAVDAGALTGTLSLSEQQALRTVLVSHTHMDHIADLGTLVDNRCQQGGPALTIAGVQGTVDALRTHFFNDVLWPDFTKILANGMPLVRFEVVQPDQPFAVGRYNVTPVMVNHTVDTSAFVISGNAGTIVYGGDTGPTDKLWEHVNTLTDLRALLVECSFPDAQAELARQSGHLTPATLERELGKLSHSRDVPVMLYHIKPVFESEILGQLGRLPDRNFSVLSLKDEFLF